MPDWRSLTVGKFVPQMAATRRRRARGQRWLDGEFGGWIEGGIFFWWLVGDDDGGGDGGASVAVGG